MILNARCLKAEKSGTKCFQYHFGRSSGANVWYGSCGEIAHNSKAPYEKKAVPSLFLQNARHTSTFHPSLHSSLIPSTLLGNTSTILPAECS